ncbi:PaaI family thioesterase [Roseovarius faecimaris]|uniref:PaaI family thioesterase n=1 Tax=Roseovarius faecimaris TaxID=2494550 RepID=A0A6I6IR37_9RHOB|nr:PaaI family thioesterase [Roseovarius faecimaris]QGX98351.1 PaaI family thioesterase [Roseovarius faecimaris]
MDTENLDGHLPDFPRSLGITLTECSAEAVAGQMTVRPEHANRNGVMHGGAVMAFADALGGTAAALNLDEGQMTTTVESKTNFLRAIPIGDRASARSIPLHRGRRTTIWQTTVSRSDGKAAAIVIQTQMTLESPHGP